jgi:hypothetical protein
MAMIPRARQGGGLSRLALEAMSDIAREHDLEALIAPVRPSWKERYPLTPIERYATWRRDDGLLFDGSRTYGCGTRCRRRGRRPGATAERSRPRPGSTAV